MSTKYGMRLISKKDFKVYDSELFFAGDNAPSFNFNSSMFRFTDVFDFSIGVPSGVARDVHSHDFVEFYFEVNSKKYNIGVGYIEDFQKIKRIQETTLSGNGRDLIGILQDRYFVKNLHSENIQIADLVKRIIKNEYIDSYTRIFKNRKGIIKPDNMYNGPFLSSSTAETSKAQILKKASSTTLNIIYQDHDGFVVVRGKRPKPKSKGVLKEGTSNVVALTIKEKYSEVYSDATTFYNAAQSSVDNQSNSSTSINYDKRIRSIIKKTFYDTFNVNDIKDFAGTLKAEQRIKQVADYNLRISNRGLCVPIISTDEPYYLDKSTGEIIPYRVGDIWTLESQDSDLTSSEFPNGTNRLDFELTGIDVKSDLAGSSIELEFNLPETIV